MLDALLTEAHIRWGLDPAPGVAVVAAERLAATPIEPCRPTILVPLGVLRRPPAGGPRAPLPGPPRPGRPDPLDVLRRLYPPTIRSAGSARPRRPRSARSSKPTCRPASTSRPVAPTFAGLTLGDALDLAACGGPDGCPWDREQTHESLRNHLLEEAYEVYDALRRAPRRLAGELGDLWLQIVLHAQIAAEAGSST